MDSFYFFFIRVYLIYHVVFQVSRKVIQLHIYMYLCLPLGSVVKESPCNEGDLGSIPGLGRYAHRHMTSLFSIFAWRISWTEEPSRLQSIGSQRVGHIWINWACTVTDTYICSFINSFSISVVTEFQAEFPVVCSRSLLVIYFIYSGIYIYVNSQLPFPPPAPNFHLVTISLPSM